MADNGIRVNYIIRPNFHASTELVVTKVSARYRNKFPTKICLRDGIQRVYLI